MFTLNDILQGTMGQASLHVEGGETVDANTIFHAAHHDSRQITPGDLFAAIKGTHIDGHSFIPTVAQKGALAALCTEPVPNVPRGFLQIVVPNVIEALQATAHVRSLRQHNTIFIGITGSNGKTSTKDAVATVLSRQAPTLKTQASYNNEIGYPLTLLRLEPEQRYAVLEMGAQWVGELAWLSRTIARPNWSLITNVGSAHLEFFGSPERVTLAKSELVQALSPEGIAILNYDDANVRGMAAKTQARVLYYGQGAGADVRGSEIAGHPLLGHSFTLHYAGQQQRVQLRLPGAHGVTIALAAAAAGCAAQMPLPEIVAALEGLSPTRGRGEVKPGPNGSTIIDDSYNANRQSILAITQAMHDAAQSSQGKRWAVLGDIFELGNFAQAEHYATGMGLVGAVDYLVGIGDQARFYIDGAIAAGMPVQDAHYFRADVENRAELEAAKQAAADLLKHSVGPQDLILLKGSRGMGMETLLDLLSGA